nr:hypothetical protein [Tanacetum cinerariifolium]
MMLDEPNAVADFMANLSSSSSQVNEEKVLTDKKELVDSYLDDNVSLQSANIVTKEMLQRFNMPTHTILMLSKKPRRATTDLDQDILACFDYAKEFAEQQLTPFYEHFKKHIEAVDAIIRKEVAEYKQIFYDLDAEYERCVLENKNLKIDKKNLLIKNDCLIAECLEKDIYSIVLSSNLVVPPSLDSSDCTLAELRTNYDKEHSKVLKLEDEVLKRQHMITESEKRCAFLENEHVNLQLKFKKYKECLQSKKHYDSSNYTTSNTIFEINKLKDQLQGKDKTIRNLQAQHDINDGLKVTNATQKTKIAKLKAKDVGNKSSGTTTPTNPKVLALGMYAIGPKYIISHRRTNRETHIPMSRKKHVTFKKPPKPIAPQVKKANVAVHLILDLMEEPLELSPSVSSSSNVTMLSRFANCQLSDRNAGSKGISAIFE